MPVAPTWKVQPQGAKAPGVVTQKDWGAEITRLGGQARQTGSEVARAAAIQRDKNDDAAVAKYYNEARQTSREYMAEQTSKYGEDGLNVYEETKSWYGEQQKEWDKRITDPRQKLKFAKRFDAMANSDLDTAINHEGKQHDLFRVETSKESISQAKNDAVANRGKSSMVDAFGVEIEENVQKIYGHMGTEYVQKKAKEEVSDMYEKVFNAMMDEDKDAALKHYESVKKFINGENQDRIEAGFKNADLKNRTFKEYDRIVGQEKAYKNRLNLADQITDGEVREGVTSLLDAKERKEQHIKSLEHETYMNGMIDQMRASGSAEKAFGIAMGAKGADKLDLSRAVNVLFPPPGPKASNLEVKLKAKDYINRGGKYTMQELLTKVFPYLDDGDQKEIEKLNDSGGFIGKLSDSQVQKTFESVSGTKPADEVEQYDAVWRYVVDNWPPDQMPTDIEVRKIVSQALASGEKMGRKGFGIGENVKNYYEAEARGEGNDFLPDLTALEEEEYSIALQEMNIPVNKYSLRMYKKHYVMGLPYPGADWLPQLKEFEEKTISREIKAANPKAAPPNDIQLRLWKKHKWLHYPVPEEKPEDSEKKESTSKTESE